MNESARRRTLFPALLASLLLAACATLAPDPPRVSVSGIEPVRMDVFEQEYALRLRIQNRSDRPLKIRGMAYDVYLNGKHFASGVDDTAIDVPPYGTRVVPVHVVTGVLDWLRQLNAFGHDHPRQLSYRLEGHMRLAGAAGRLRFEHEGRIEPPGTPRPGR